MSTRSLTYIHEMTDESLTGENLVCVFYRQADGYPSGHGQDLADWLKGKTLVNGKGPKFDRKTMFNRAGTMAVKLVNHIQDIAGAELMFGQSFDCGQDHDYHVYFRGGEFWIKLDERNLVKASEFDGHQIEDDIYAD